MASEVFAENLDQQEDRSRALTCVLWLGGLIGITDCLWLEGFPLHSVLAFVAGCVLLLLVLFLRFTKSVRLTMLLAILATSVVFLGNFFIYGATYYLVAGFAIPLSAAMFLGTRDAIFALLFYVAFGTIVGAAIHVGIWEPPLVLASKFQLVINGLLIIVAMSLTTIWRERLLKISKQREQRQKNRLSALVRGCYGLLYETDVDGKIIFVTGGLIEDLGFESNDLIGQQHLELFHESDLHLLPCSGQFDPESGYDIEVRMLAADGRDKWVRISAVSVQEHGASRWINAVQDIHETVLQRKKVFEIARLESLGELSAGLAHDFNNLLTVIGINAEFIPDENIRDEILSAQKQAVDLTAGLLTFARRQETRTQNVDVGDFLMEMRPMVEKLAGIYIECEWSTVRSAATVNVDPHQMQQVIINLVTNAVHAMPDGGRLHVSCTTTDVPPDFVFDNKKNGSRSFAVLSVSDTGGGMSEETKRRAVEPFFTTKPRGQGTGLGLATAHGAVQAAGGVLRIDSELDIGTTISIYLPSAEVLASLSDGDEVLDAEEFSNLCVLVVEDREEVRTTLKKLLNASGFSVAVAGNAEEALLMVEEQAFDLIVSDIELPEMNGIDFGKELLHSGYPGKLLLISGYQDCDLEIVPQYPDTVRFLAKPFSSHAFLKLTKSMILKASNQGMVLGHEVD